LPVADLHVAPDAERALVQRMAQGDEAALAALYDRYGTLLHSMALRIVGDPDDAEEVVEEAFWQAWRQAGRYHPERGGISTWLVMIVRSRALDRVRAERRFRDALPVSAAEPLHDLSRPSPLDAAAADERSRRVAEVVATLPAEQRRTVEMAYYGGMSQSEIAAATGEPLGTVKTRARLALQKLRGALAGLQEDAR
jgi:RNA polymerase sigma-70 factor (ECF subfamily)